MTAVGASAPARPTPPAGWSAPINGFRGFAAIVVVVGHTFFATRLFPYRGVIHFISIIVPLFFVISAFALYRPFVEAHLADRPAPDPWRFWWRRLLRIYPLFAVALTLYLILLPGVRPASGRVIDYVKLYSFLQVYDPDLVRFSGIPAAWFLCDEVVFYLMIPGIALLGRWLVKRLAGPRRAAKPAEVLRAHALVAAAMIVVGQASRTYLLHLDYPGATSLPVSNLDYYGFGILLALATLREERGRALPRAVDWVRGRPWVALVVLAVGAIAMNEVARAPGATSGAIEDMQRYGVYSVMVVPFMIVMCLGDADRSFNRWFSSTRWNHLALISLHVYLWHQLVLGGFDRYVTEVAEVRIGTPLTTGVILCIGAVGATVAWASLLRPGLDAPYRRWGSNLPRRPLGAGSPRWARPAAAFGAVALLGAGVLVAVAYGGSPVRVQASVGQLAVTHARPGDAIVVRHDGDEVGRTDADERGTAVVRDLAPGRYEVVQQRSGRRVVSRETTVPALDDRPPASFYEGQHLHPGLNEIVARDGTRLSAYVHLPGPEADGPYPTVVEYSGYQIADPDVTQPASAVARALGYATVGVNLRGTGCSAGAFEMLGEVQVADGYDVVEAVAAQPWVRGGRVGLVGFSYGGLGALEAASGAPPSLSGVAALSVYGEARQAFHPGGLSNSGFPVGWMQDLSEDAAPAGADWVQRRIADGDAACARNQLLHGQAVDLIDRYLGDAPDDGRFDALSPATWAPSIDVPVFLAGQLQDATIGTDLADHLEAFSAAPVRRLVLTNGTHGDAVSPQVLRRMDQFLSLYVAGEVPGEFDTAELLAETRPEVDPDLVPDGPAPLDLTAEPDLDAARGAYAAAPSVEVLFESGNGGRPQAAAAATSMTFATWPPSEDDLDELALAPGGRLADAGAAEPEPVRFTTDGSVSGEAYNIEGSDLVTNAVSPWVAPDPATAADWISTPMARDVALVGSTELELWVRLDQRDVDLQATLSEVAADGSETFIQAGWRRASDAADVVQPGAWTIVPIRLGPVGHLLRAGSRLRLVVGTPGDGQVQWSFYPPPHDGVTVEVGQGGAAPSTLRVPSVATSAAPAPAACGDLRGQPCRTYAPLAAAAPAS